MFQLVYADGLREVQGLINEAGGDIFLDRNEADHFDFATFWGKFMTAVQPIAPEYLFLFQISNDADSGGMTKTIYADALDQLLSWYATDQGYTPTFLSSCSKPNTWFGNDYGRNEVEQAHIESDNGTTRFYMGPQHDYNPSMDGVHVQAAQHLFIGRRLGIALGKGNFRTRKSWACVTKWS